MDTLEKNEQLNRLYQLYKPLLTEKQQSYFEAYYHEDYSLSEIASYYQVSRHAIFDQLNKATEHLNDYEAKLGLLKKKQTRQDLIDAYMQSNDSIYLHKLKEMDDN